MAILTGVFRLGRDAEVRSTASGDQVTTLSLAYNYGKKENGKRPTQWVDAALWGERGPKLQEWLVQGAQISVVLEDVRLEEFKKRDGSQGFKLAARVASLEFVNTPRRGDGQQRTSPPPQARPDAQAPRPSSTGSGFDDMDDDIPF